MQVDIFKLTTEAIFHLDQFFLKDTLLCKRLFILPTIRTKFLFCKAVSEASASLNVTSCSTKCKFVFQEKHNGYYNKVLLSSFSRCVGMPWMKN